MTADDIMRQIDAKRTRQRELAGSLHKVPAHIAQEVELELSSLHLEIDELKAELFRANGGKSD